MIVLHQTLCVDYLSTVVDFLRCWLYVAVLQLTFSQDDYVAADISNVDYVAADISNVDYVAADFVKCWLCLQLTSWRVDSVCSWLSHVLMALKLTFSKVDSVAADFAHVLIALLADLSDGWLSWSQWCGSVGIIIRIGIRDPEIFYTDGGKEEIFYTDGGNEEIFYTDEGKEKIIISIFFLKIQVF